MPAPFSSDVVAGDDALATQYNNLRKDTINTTDGHNHDGSNSRQLADRSVNAAKAVHYAGDELVIDGGDSALQTGSGNGILKRIGLARGGEYRIKFQLEITDNGVHGISDSITGQIYRNGAPVGTLRTLTQAGVGAGTVVSPVYSEDLSGWIHTDDLEINCAWILDVGASCTARVINLEVYADAIEVPIVTL